MALPDPKVDVTVLAEGVRDEPSTCGIMIYKQMDSRQGMIDQLRDLLDQAPPSDVRRKIETALGRLIKGVEGEREVAKAINRRYGSDDRYAVIHDLHIRVGDVSVQIDHVVIHRLLCTAYVFETKNMPGGLEVDADGMWTAGTITNPIAVSSPVVQAKSASELLLQWFDEHEHGLVTELKAVVVATIATKLKGDVGDGVIRSDGIDRWGEQTFNDRSLYDLISRLWRSKRRGFTADRLANLAKQLVHHHKPIRLDPTAEFHWRPTTQGRDRPSAMPNDPHDGTENDDLIHVGGGIVMKRNHQGYAIRHGKDSRTAEIVAEIGSRHGTWNERWMNWNVPKAVAREVASSIRERLS